MKPSPWTGDKYGVNSEAFVVLRCAVPQSLVLHELIQRNCRWWKGGKHANQPTAKAQHRSGAQPCWLWCGTTAHLLPGPALCSPLSVPQSHSPSSPAHRGLVGEMWLCLWVAFPIVLFYVFLKEMSSNLPGAAPASGPEVWRGGAVTSG